jgi:hypothetical protein
LTACVAGGTARPSANPPAPRIAEPVVVGPAPKQSLVAEMCEDRAEGRPALTILVSRQLEWQADPSELDAMATRVAARPFVVLSAKGGRAGVFEGVGTVDLATERPAVGGGYAGRAVCEDARTTLVDAACVEAQGRCGLAVGSLEVDGVDEAPALVTGGACLTDGVLTVDIDGDGRRESFPARAFLDELNAPATEVTSSGVADKNECTASFALPGLVKGKDAKAFRALDLYGVVDLDGDDRLEIVMQYRYANVRTLAIYSAPTQASRLEMVAEVEPWGAAE